MNIPPHSSMSLCPADANCPLCYNNIIDAGRRVVWMLMPKAATVSVRASIGDTPSRYQTHWAWHSFDHIRWYAHDFLWVGFVRNPFARLVSCWAQKVKDNRGAPHRTFPYYGIKNLMSFEEFAEIAINTPPERADKHWRPMSYEYIYQGDIAPHIIVRTETLAPAMHRLDFALQKKGARGLHPIMHQHRSHHEHYRKYYSIALRKRVADYYAEDLEAFNYEF